MLHTSRIALALALACCVPSECIAQSQYAFAPIIVGNRPTFAQGIDHTGRYITGWVSDPSQGFVSLFDAGSVTTVLATGDDSLAHAVQITANSPPLVVVAGATKVGTSEQDAALLSFSQTPEYLGIGAQEMIKSEAIDLMAAYTTGHNLAGRSQLSGHGSEFFAYVFEGPLAPNTVVPPFQGVSAEEIVRGAVEAACLKGFSGWHTLVEQSSETDRAFFWSQGDPISKRLAQGSIRSRALGCESQFVVGWADVESESVVTRHGFRSEINLSGFYEESVIFLPGLAGTPGESIAWEASQTCVVGEADGGTNSLGRSAFVWRDNRMYDIKLLLACRSGGSIDLSDWVLTRATGISLEMLNGDILVICGHGEYLGDGRSWVATIPDSQPLLMCDFNGDGLIDSDDLGDFTNAYFAMPPSECADYNADGVVDPDDLGDYINDYFNNCV